jgi:hypothetical protein
LRKRAEQNSNSYSNVPMASPIVAIRCCAAGPTEGQRQLIEASPLLIGFD